MKSHYPFENTPLPYAYDALEPYIDEKTMQLHHDRHLKTYIDNLNSILKKYPQLQTLTLEQLICTAGQMSGKDCVAIARNAGGVYNHRFFSTACVQMGKKHPAVLWPWPLTVVLVPWMSFGRNLQRRLCPFLAPDMCGWSIVSEGLAS